MKSAVFIISHERPECVTYHNLRLCGYSGQIFIIIDDKDSKQDEYKNRYKDSVLIFSKADYSKADMCDLVPNLNSATIPKYAAFTFAQEMKLDAMAIFDDDLESFRYRYRDKNKIATKKMQDYPFMQKVLDACFDFVSEQNIPTCVSFYPEDKFFPDTYDKFIRQCINSFITTPNFGLKLLGRSCLFSARFYEDEIFFVRENTRGALCFALQDFTFCSALFENDNNKGGMYDVYQGYGLYSRKFQLVINNPWNSPMTIYDKGGEIRVATKNSDYTRIIPEKYKKH